MVSFQNTFLTNIPVDAHNISVREARDRLDQMYLTFYSF